MQLFRWRSEAMKRYQSGHILAMGADVEDARTNARKHFETVAREQWEWLFERYPDYALDEDAIAERDEKLALLEADIVEEPESSDAFFIAGSE